MLLEVHGRNPAVLHVLEPLLIVVVFGAVEVEHVFADEDEFADALVGHQVDDVAFELHHVVFDGIVPLPDELDNSRAQLVVNEQNFQKQRLGPHAVPLRMDVVAVDGIDVGIQAVFGPLQGRKQVFGGRVLVDPGVMRLNGVHG